MDAGDGGGGGGPAPFLIKTYDMVDDSSTDGIVSWSSSYHSFVVWNPPEFSRLLLPAYFKHNNFSSFIRQLNTYGFRKIDPERWEFANEDFVKDQRHLLKNIHRRKPVHSHSQPNNPLGDAERTTYEEQIDKLSREKSALQSNLLRFENQLASTNAQMDILEKQVLGMEQRQLRMMSFLAKAVQNPSFVEHLIRMAGTTVDFSMNSKKRRLPCIEFSQEFDENHCVDTQRSSSKLHDGFSDQDFSNKLKLELCPAVSDCTLMSTSVQSSMEDGECPILNASNEDPRAARTGATECSREPEILELSDTGTCSGLKKILSLFGQSRAGESLEDGDVCCQLNLSLASSTVPEDRHSHGSTQDLLSTSNELSSNSNVKEVEPTTSYDKNPEKENAVPSMQGSLYDNNQGSGAPQTRVNDIFWEQFLTERPGCSDNEVANSSLKSHSYAEQEERTTANTMFGRSIKDAEQLTL